MNVNYKTEIFPGSAQRQISKSDDSQKLIKEFNNSYYNLKQTFELDHNSSEYINTLISFIRHMKILIMKKGQSLNNFYIEREFIENLLDILKSDDDYVIVSLLEEVLDLLNCLIVLINIPNPISIFEGNESLLFDILNNLIKMDYESLNQKIIILLTLIYNGTVKSTDFVFSILPLEDIEKLAEYRTTTYDICISNLIKRFAFFSIPSDKIEYIYIIIKKIFAKGCKNSFLSCIESLILIVGYVHDEKRDEESKENIKKLYEQDDDLENYCIECLKLDDFRIPKSVFLLISEICRAEFDLTKFEKIFKEAYEALDIYSIPKYPNNVDIRRNAAMIFRNAFYFDFNRYSFLRENALSYAKRLSETIEDDAYSVAEIACQALLLIIKNLSQQNLETIIIHDRFFHILNRILEYESPLLLLMNVINICFNFAESFNYLQKYIENFISYKIIDNLIENKEKSQNEEEIQQVDVFLAHFEKVRKEYTNSTE